MRRERVRGMWNKNTNGMLFVFLCINYIVGGCCYLYAISPVVGL